MKDCRIRSGTSVNLSVCPSGMSSAVSDAAPAVLSASCCPAHATCELRRDGSKRGRSERPAEQQDEVPQPSCMAVALRYSIGPAALHARENAREQRTHRKG
eukprot:1160685-Rhodomonas_salina.2